MSPEQLDDEISDKTDLWSLGAMVLDFVEPLLFAKSDGY